MASISKKFSYLNADFVQPTSVVDTLLCIESGELATEFCKQTKLYPVNLEVPPPPCGIHSPQEERFDVFYGW